MSTDWNTLYKETYGDLVRFLYRKVWDEERAQELAQEVFVRGLKNQPDRPRAWLFVTAANLARDEVRKVVRRKRHLALLRPEEGTTPEDALLESEQRSQVQAALSALSERDREALLLWDAGLSYGDIARETGLSKSAVGTTLARARKRLVAAHRGKEVEDDAAHR